MIIGTIDVKPGDKIYGAIKVANRIDGLPLNISVMIVNGVKDGPTLVVSAGFHGDEFEGMETVRSLWKACDPSKINGVFVGVPVANVLSFEAGSLLNPIDHLNLWRVFPGKPDGSISMKIAYAFSTEILSKAEYYIDLHSRGNPLDTANFTVITNDEEKNVDFARALGFDLIMLGSLSGTPIGEASKKGIPAMLVEVGGEGRCHDHNIDLLFKAVTNVMKYLGMIRGKPELVKRYAIIAEPEWIRAKHGGFFVPAAKSKHKITKGTTMGNILDPFGENIEKIQAPYDCIITHTRTFPATNPGDWLFYIGKIAKTISPSTEKPSVD